MKFTKICMKFTKKMTAVNSKRGSSRYHWNFFAPDQGSHWGR